jgi:hypothetical protein
MERNEEALGTLFLLLRAMLLYSRDRAWDITPTTATLWSLEGYHPLDCLRRRSFSIGGVSPPRLPQKEVFLNLHDFDIAVDWMGDDLLERSSQFQLPL